MQEATEAIAIPIYKRRGFKKCIGTDCARIIKEYTEEHDGQFDAGDFSKQFNAFTAAHKLYRRVPDIDRFNVEGVKKTLFLKEIAYVFDRHIPYYIYRKYEEMNGRQPKTICHWPNMVFPKDSLPGASLYQYQVDEDELSYELKLLCGVANPQEDDNEETAAEATDVPACQTEPCIQHDECNTEVQDIVGSAIELPAMELPYDRENARLARCGGRKSGPFVALTSQFTQEKIFFFMDKYGYSDENYAIMAGDEEYLKFTNPVLFGTSKMSELRHDGRTVMMYYQDMVSSWLYENMVMDCINNKCQTAKLGLAGVDRERKILVGDSGVNNQSDFMAVYRGQKFPIELSMSHTGYAYWQEKINLRNRKREHLKAENSILLSIETFALDVSKHEKPDGLLFAMVWGDEYDMYYTEKNPRFYNKECDCLSIKFDKYRRLDEFCILLEERMEREFAHMHATST